MYQYSILCYIKLRKNMTEERFKNLTKTKKDLGILTSFLLFYGCRKIAWSRSFCRKFGKFAGIGVCRNFDWLGISCRNFDIPPSGFSPFFVVKYTHQRPDFIQPLVICLSVVTRSGQNSRFAKPVSHRSVFNRYFPFFCRGHLRTHDFHYEGDPSYRWVSTLEISRFRSKDENVYRCILTNSIGRREGHIRLHS